MHGLQLVTNENIFFMQTTTVFLPLYPKRLAKQIKCCLFILFETWLEVNLDKTKIIVFRKGGFLGTHEKWYYNNLPLETLNEYNYLVVQLSS